MAYQCVRAALQACFWTDLPTRHRHIEINNCQMVMVSHSSHDELTAAVQRYGEVADAVIRQRMQHFIDEVISKWVPEHPGDGDIPHLDGYTEAGAQNLNIYYSAFFDVPDHPTHRPLCLAEQYDQILLEPPRESFVDLIPKPLTDPLPSDQITAKLEALEAALRQQVAEASESTTQQEIHLPPDFAALMAITNGLQGAGVPKETAGLELIFPLEHQKVESGLLKHLSHWVATRTGYTAIAAWKIGACIQHRSIYYVLCRSAEDEAGTWRVLNHVDVETDWYENLTHFILHETEHVEKTPGGALTEEILTHDRYPIY